MGYTTFQTDHVSERSLLAQRNTPPLKRSGGVDSNLHSTLNLVVFDTVILRSRQLQVSRMVQPIQDLSSRRDARVCGRLGLRVCLVSEKDDCNGEVVPASRQLMDTLTLLVLASPESPCVCQRQRQECADSVMILPTQSIAS